MQPDNEGNLLEIIGLAHTLRQEQLFIQHEQSSFERLSETFSQNSSAVARLGWICAQHRQNLNHLVVTRTNTGPSVCCQRANRLENTKFIDASKAKGLKYQHVIAYIELFNYLYRSPYLLAQSLAAGDRITKISVEQINSVIHTISTSLYGNTIHSKDIETILKLLRELIEIQIVISENPRRMLRAESSAFARLYYRLLESLFSAKIFLTAALHVPVMLVLVKSENILDIDPNKAIMNLTAKERLKRFGDENLPEYNINVEKYRHETINELFLLAKQFLDNLILNWSLFPSTLRWLVQTMYHQLKQTQHINDKDINEIITDMVFTHFICPAIVSPDIFGISDAPISEQARFNLIQIGQIIQMLAILKYEDIEPKFIDIYEKFDQNIVSKLLEQLLVNENGDEGNGVVAIRSQQNDYERVEVLITHNELNIFVDYFRIVLANDELSISGDDRRKLGKILDILPDKFENIVNGGNNETTQLLTQPETSHRAKQSLINLGKSTKNKLAKTISHIGGQENEDQLNGINLPINNSTSNNNNTQYFFNYDENNEQVLVFPISITDENKLQLLTEEEVLKMNSIGQEIDDPVLIEENIEKLDKVDSEGGFDEMVSVLRPSHSKTTRFSLSHDDASIGNSDNLEAVSEAPSNHSVTSSLELEENDQNDNLSDMVSANVSGRGSPNISGRDTPSSQVTDGGGDNIPQIPTPQMAKIINKARSDIEDKFCKFEIKKLIEGDETISIISDTWSTDVLASDSETVDATERDRNFSTPLIPSAVVLPGDNNFDVLSSSRPQRNYLALDASETRSESAWSTDVLVSDSEKFLAEVDTDDNLSITAKSDTTDAGRSEGEPGREIDNLTPNQSNQNRTPDSPYFAPRSNVDLTNGIVGSVNFQTPDSPVYAARSVESPFFPNTNSYEDPTRENPRFNSPISSLARSSVRTTNQYSGENTFQQNYKSGCTERSSYLHSVAASGGGDRIRRQNSAESSISNQSLNMDDNFDRVVDGTINNSNNGGGDGGGDADNSVVEEILKEKCVERKSRKSCKDLIDFNDFQEEVDGASGGVDNDNKVPDPDEEAKLREEDEDYRSLYEKFSEEHVIHRRTSSEQRNASFDGRRNGMSTYQPGDSASMLCRRHQSLNYENHEIILNKNTIQHLPPNINATINIDDPPSDNNIIQLQNDDEILLIEKTTNLHISSVEDAKSKEENIEIIDGGIESILTVVDIIQPEQNGNGNGLEENLVKTSTKSTGAIPKSISFDASADKSLRNSSNYNNRRTIHDPLKLNGTGFFNKIKQGFKNRRSNKTTSSRLNSDEYSTRNVSFGINLESDNSTNDSRRQQIGMMSNENGYNDMTEDILAKYRRKVSTSSETTNSDSTGNSCSVNRKNSDIESRMSNGILVDKAYAFIHAKKKIRTVLSTTDLHTGDFRHTTYSNASPLLIYLQIQLAQALNLQNFQQISYVSEAIRTLSSLDSVQHIKLIEELQADILKRQSYLQYLMRYRQNLLSTIKNIDQFEKRLRSDRDMYNRHLISVCVRMFLEKREHLIEKFQQEFCLLTVVDEKIDLLQEFIEKLIKQLKLDGIIFGMVDWQLDEAKISIERILLHRLYKHVMFPNDDGDIFRDEVLYKHIRKLQKIITPGHLALRIPQEYLNEAPWPFAQEQISYISAYKTPREKLQCVIRCISSILNLLSMACDRIPATDDLIPVLIYVVIMANPPYLLSTIEFVNCFIGNELDGQDEFHWTQFSSVVQFIKTLDYLD